MRFPLSRPQILEEDILAVNRVLRSGMLVQGKQVAAFEAAIGGYVGNQNVAATSSGTAALHLALLSAGVGAGDLVIVPNFSFAATGNAVCLSGATPVFVDVLPTSYCIDLAAADAICRSHRGAGKVKAIIIVHEFGFPVEMSAVNALAREHDLLVIEDAACAIGAFDGSGAKSGSTADYGCYSFHPRKTVTTGEGGAVVTRTTASLATVKRLRDHGIDRAAGSMHFKSVGFNYRMTDFQAALGVGQLERLDDVLAVRRTLKDTYLSRLAGCEATTLPDAPTGHSWQTFMVRLDPAVNRDKLVGRLASKGIQSGPAAQAMLSLPSFAEIATQYEHKDWVSTALYRHGLALPFCQDFTSADLGFIADEVLGESKALM